MDKDNNTSNEMTHISNLLLETTKNLAENLSQSEQFIRFKKAEHKLNTDPEALKLLNDFSEMQKIVRTQQYSDVLSKGDLQQLRDLQGAVAKDKTIQEYGLSQQLTIEFLRKVNQEIGQLIGVDFASLTRRSTC